ncbi:patatin family protein [Carboxylicivirga sp. A043]|uniref:patatin-like phospholipase family protein n=1 Tax=Carboxylicivirga litoralis TaxID=2816963 RepID=UPI0021CB367A|nr:patatin family protein [Carboxylicivirga sp. A043]MCU4157005.1 patatin family protein [Carboxylicivirga sp. A043]
MEYKVNETGLVLEGGGFRGIFSAGVMDYFLKRKLHFSYAIGVSAGAAYGISYASQQFGRNRVINEKYTADPRYMSWGNWIKTGNLFNPDFIYDEITNRLVPFDYEAAFNSFCDFNIVITNVVTGKAEYYSSKQLNQNQLLKAIQASGSLPMVSKMVEFNNGLYLDGGVADSIPIHQAFKSGCRRAVVILTRNREYRKEPAKFQWLIKSKYAKYPKLVDQILSRAEHYNTTLDELEHLEKEGKVYIIRPKAQMMVSRIENNPQKLDLLYQQGFNEMNEEFDELMSWLKG